jgi:hypothetical protein
MDKLFEGLDEDSNLSVKEMKSRFLAYEAEKKKKEDELQNQMAEMTAMLKNLTAGGTSSGASASKESYHDVNHDYPRNTSPMPHINHSGTVPHYDGTHFPHWKSAMESHIRSCSVELWELIVHGYPEPQDPTRLTSTEFYNRQLNASACDKIRSGINRKLLDQVNDIDSAKEPVATSRYITRRCSSPPTPRSNPQLVPPSRATVEHQLLRLLSYHPGTPVHQLRLLQTREGG